MLFSNPLQRVTMLSMNRVVRLRKRDNHTPCGYCFSKWATGYDHIIPVAYDGINNGDQNLYPCCKRCNAILRDFMPGGLSEKREYVRARLIEMGQWHLPEVQGYISEKETTSKVLFSDMPLGVVERATPARTPRNTHCARCGKGFIATNPKRIYCSTKCTGNTFIGPRLLIKCSRPDCNATFLVKRLGRRRLCENCQNPTYEKRIGRCAECGDEFKTYYKTTRFCCRECAAKQYRKTHPKVRTKGTI